MRVVTQIKKSLGNVIIDWVIKDSLVEIIKANDLVRKIYLFKRGQGLKSYIKLLQAVRKLSRLHSRLTGFNAERNNNFFR